MRPLFDYGDTIWGDKGNATLMNELQLLQNKAAKNFVGHHFLNLGYFTAVSSFINM